MYVSISRILYPAVSGTVAISLAPQLLAGSSVQSCIGLAPGKCFPHDPVAGTVWGLLLCLAVARVSRAERAPLFSPLPLYTSQTFRVFEMTVGGIVSVALSRPAIH